MTAVRVLILLLLVLALPAEAQDVVRRCVNASGQVEYRDIPCPGTTKGARVRKRAESETYGGESAAAIEKRAAAIREAQYAADQAHIAARAAAAAARAQQQQQSSGLSPYTPASPAGSTASPGYRVK